MILRHIFIGAKLKEITIKGIVTEGWMTEMDNVDSVAQGVRKKTTSFKSFIVRMTITDKLWKMEKGST